MSVFPFGLSALYGQRPKDCQREPTRTLNPMATSVTTTAYPRHDVSVFKCIRPVSATRPRMQLLWKTTPAKGHRLQQDFAAVLSMLVSVLCSIVQHVLCSQRTVGTDSGHAQAVDPRHSLVQVKCTAQAQLRQCTYAVE